MKLFTRQLHTNSTTSVVAPDDATLMRLDIARDHPSTPSNWDSNKDPLEWSIFQYNENTLSWQLLGSSRTVGGLFTDDTGECCLTSWDETPLMPGIGRTMRVVLRALHRPVDTEVEVTWL